MLWVDFCLFFIFVFALFYLKGALWTSSEICNFIILLSVFSIYLKSFLIKYEKIIIVS